MEGGRRGGSYRKGKVREYEVGDLMKNAFRIGVEGSFKDEWKSGMPEKRDEGRAKEWRKERGSRGARE